jgi:hypothetical protein
MFERTHFLSRITSMDMAEGTTKTETNGESEGADWGTPVWVQCTGFRCLAYQDADGKWRTLFRGEVLSDAVSIAEASRL